MAEFLYEENEKMRIRKKKKNQFLLNNIFSTYRQYTTRRYYIILPQKIGIVQKSLWISFCHFSIENYVSTLDIVQNFGGAFFWFFGTFCPNMHQKKFKIIYHKKLCIKIWYGSSHL